MASIQKQALRSGLAFLGCDNDDDVPQWTTTEWPTLLGGWRSHHASVVVDHDEDQQTVLVAGGYNTNKYGSVRETSSVLLLSVGANEKKWKEGPDLNFCRMDHASVVCNGTVYILGGVSGAKAQAVIEKMDVVDLTRDTSAQWTTAKFSLMTGRKGCAAAVVKNRYIVVAGGISCDGYGGYGNNSVLSSVEIIDITEESPYAVTSGPSMNVAR